MLSAMSMVRGARREEAALLFAWNYCAVAAYFTGRSVRDALFLAHESPSRLPLMYIASPIAVSLVGFVYARIADRVRRDRAAQATALAFAVLATGAWFALGARWVYYALYAGVDVMGSLLMMQFWTSAGDRFSPREARRLFGLIAAGGTVANITVGLALAQAVARTGAEAMVLACGFFLVAVAMLSRALARRPGSRAPAPRARLKAPTPDAPPGTGHLVLLGPMIACGVLAATLLDFQYKTLAVQTFAGDRVAMLRFFALLSSAFGVVSLGVQFFVTARLLERLGVVGALLLYPGTLGLSAVGLLSASSLATATVSKFGDVFRYTVHDAAMQLLYLPVPAAVRGRRKATLDGVIKPGTEALVGASLFVYRSLSGALTPLAAATLLVTALWIAVTLRMRPAYARSLSETLRRRRIAVDGPDHGLALDLAQAVRGALGSTDPAELLHALDLASLAPRPLADALRPLTDHPDPAVRARALGCLAAGDSPLDDPALDRALHDPDPGVRAQAAGAATGAQVARVGPLLDAPEAEVVAAAGRALHRHGSPDDRRRVVARVTGLLADPDPAVRTRGLEVARAVADVALLPALVARFGDRRDARHALEAAAAVGSAAEPALVEALDSPSQAPAAVRALGRLGSPAALGHVAVALSASDERTRDAACEALARAAAEARTRSLPTAAMLAACEADLTRAFAATAAAVGLGRAESALLPDGTRALVPYRPDEVDGPAALISRALRERSERARDRLFHLLGALEPDLDVATILANLDEPDPVRRANAVELLDASSWRSPAARLKPLVLALVDESPRELKLAAVRRRLDLPARGRDAWVAALLDDPNAWMTACAAYYAGSAGVVSVRPTLDALSRDPRPVVRQAAAAALATLDEKPHPVQEGAMITTAEKVLFLKGIELFAAVPSEDLVELAAIATEVSVEESDEIFREGDHGDALYFVVDGSVRIEQGGRPLGLLGERDVFGEMALLDAEPRSATALAATASTLLRIGHDDFAAVLLDRPQVAAGVLRVVTRRLRAANQRSPLGPDAASR